MILALVFSSVELQQLGMYEYTVAPVPCAFLAPASMALSLWGTPLLYSAPRTIVIDVGGMEEDKLEVIYFSVLGIHLPVIGR